MSAEEAVVELPARLGIPVRPQAPTRRCCSWPGARRFGRLRVERELEPGEILASPPAAAAPTEPVRDVGGGRLVATVPTPMATSSGCFRNDECRPLMAYFKGVQAAAIRTGAPPSPEQLKRFVALYRALDIARYGLSAISERGYRSHNPEPMRQDVIEEPRAARPETGTIETLQLRSLSEAEAEQELEDLERDAAKLG